MNLRLHAWHLPRASANTGGQLPFRTTSSPDRVPSHVTSISQTRIARQCATLGKLKGTHVAPFLGFVATFISLLTAISALRSDFTGTLLCGTALGTVVVLLIGVAARSSYDLFEPLSFVILSTLIGTTLKLLFVVFSGSGQVDRILLNEPRGLLVTGSAFILVGLVALVAGYSFRLRSVTVSHWSLMRRPYWNRNILTVVAWLALLVSLAAFVVWFGKMGIQIDTLASLSQKRFISVDGSQYRTGLAYWGWPVSAAESAFYLLLSWRYLAPRRMPWPARLALPLTAVITLGFPILQSTRWGVIEVVLIALILQHYLRGGIRYRTLAIALPITLTALLVVTAVRHQRDFWTATERISLQTLLSTTVGGRHFLDVGKTSHIIDAVPERLAHSHGATLFRWITAPIPRIWWPEKPSLGSGPLIGTEIYGTAGAGVPPGFVAELYMNFGAFGIPAGMFLLGVLLRALYTSFATSRHNPNAILLYAVIVIPLSAGLLQTDLSTVIVRVLLGALPLVVLLRAMGRDRPGPATA